MAAPSRRRATYEDLLQLPEHKVGELIDGELYASPRLRIGHAAAACALVEELGPPFKRGRGGPGGWILLMEPELHFGEDVLVPDVAGWRRERMPALDGEAPFIAVVPDWICEVISPSTEKLDRARKLPIYAGVGVAWAWIVNPRLRTLEVMQNRDGKWLVHAVHRDDQRVRIAPFDAIEIDLSMLWADVTGWPHRAGEEPAAYADA